MEIWLDDAIAKQICRHRAVTNKYIANKLNSGTPVPRAEWTRWAHEYDAVNKCLAVLAGLCDGGHQRDGVGFSKFDAKNGKRLAYQRCVLTNDEFWQAVRIVRKYHKQIDPKLTAWLPVLP